MTPQELYDALDARRREYSPRMPWWRVAVEMDVSLPQLHRLKGGANSPPVRRRAQAWLSKTANVQTGQGG